MYQPTDVLDYHKSIRFLAGYVRPLNPNMFLFSRYISFYLLLLIAPLPTPIAKISKKIRTSPNGIHNGENTHHQFHAITPHSFNIIKANSKSDPKPPSLILIFIFCFLPVFIFSLSFRKSKTILSVINYCKFS